tara:strand:- start:30080 stop:33031 length:2952 start_codon:yes stop_codon:yes gene_type:complete
MFPPAAFAQALGQVQGRVIDSQTGEPVFGVTVIVQGQNKFAQTDFDGKYQIQLEPGTYTLVYQMVGFESRTRSITIQPGQAINANVTMGTPAATQAEVVVTDRALNNTEASLLALQKKATNVSDGISAEAIKKSPDSNASDVVKRVTGISVVDGRFVFVRGLGERYSTTILNGAVLTSTEPDKRVVPLDLFPASLIKNIRVIKSFVPEETAEFSGGLVRIETKEYPDELEISLGLGLNWNSNTTYRTFKHVPYGGGNDYLGLGPNSITGFGSERWNVPGIADSGSEYFPFTEGTLYNRGIINLGAAQFNNEWDPKVDKAPIGTTLSFSIGDSFDLGDGKRFGYLYATYRKKDYQYIRKQEFRYSSLNLIGGGEWNPDFNYISGILNARQSDEYTESVLWGNNLNLAYQFAPNQQIYSKTFLSTNSEKKVNDVYGLYRGADDLDYVIQTTGYVAREVFAETLGGDHAIQILSDMRPHKLGWFINYTRAVRDEPDFRTRNWEVFPNSGNPLTRTANDGRRFYSLSEDVANTIHLDYELPYQQWSGLEAKLKLGYERVTREKEFTSRTFRYNRVSGADTTAEQWPTPGDFTFNPARLFAGEYTFSEAANVVNSYEAEQNNDIIFVQTDLPIIPKLRVITGFRSENSYQKVKTYKSDDIRGRALTDSCLPKDGKYFHPSIVESGLCPADNNGVGEDDKHDILPSLNVVYELTEKQNLRFAYGETLTRPDFRELSDFAFSPYFAADIEGGNPTLTRSYIHNYDFRWEYYMTPEEYAGIGVFYKNISQPIERVGQPASGDGSLTYTYINSERAYIQGIELDLRKAIIEQLFVKANAYLIESRVEVMSYAQRTLIATGQLSIYDRLATLAPTNIERPLQGQSDLVYNIGLEYFFDSEQTISAGAFYNYYGDRLTYVGAFFNGDVYERGTGIWDLVFTYEPTEQLSVKAAWKNIFDPSFEQYQENALFGSDVPFSSYKRGMDFSISASYKF